MEIVVDHKLRVALTALPHDIRHLIESALTIPNVERQKQMEQGIFGWQHLPEQIEMWSVEEGCLIAPRGFESSLISGLSHYKIPFVIKDGSFFESLPAHGTPVNLRAWQVPAVEAILSHRNGIYKAPAGSGKTVAVLEAIRRLKTRSIVLVNTKDILWQWQARAREYLGEDFPVGQIGDGVFEPSNYLTISTAQTLHRHFDRLEREGFFDSFGFMCLDECHHATADTYNKLVNRFSSRHRIGVSATPDKTGDFDLATTVLGPIFHVTSKNDVSSLIDPVVVKVPTQFRFAYHGRRGRIPSNYPQLLKALVTDNHRNMLIAQTIKSEDGTHSLLISKRLEHLDLLGNLVESLGYRSKIMYLTGSETSEERKRVIEYASENPCLILSTLADEALDVPRLDRLFLGFPQRNPGLVAQQSGRVCRVHPDKPDAIIYDFVDHLVGPLEAQWRVRRLQVYQPHGYKVNTRSNYELA